PVESDSSAHQADTDRAHLPLTRPHASLHLVPVELDSDVARGTDHDLLEVSDVPDGVGLRTDVHDRIAHELAGAVEGEAPTPVDEMQLRPGGTDPILAPHDVLWLPTTSRRVHGRVLQEDQRVGDIAGEGPTGQIVHGLLTDCVGHGLRWPDEPPRSGHRYSPRSSFQSQVSMFSLILARNWEASAPSITR